MNPAQKQLVLQDVSHSYARSTVLEQVSFTIVAGRIIALVGPSGCGKTTLMHLCAGLEVLRNGRIDNTFVTPACMFQQPRLLPWKRAIDNIALGLKAAGIPRHERTTRAAALGQRMGLLPDDLQKYPHQLSGGMQSRVALARALVMEPDLMLLDEPFSALDIGLKQELYALLLQHLNARHIGVLLITHDLMEAVRLSSEIMVMAAEPGRIVRRFTIAAAPETRDDAFVYHTTAQLLQDKAVRSAFALGNAVPVATPTESTGALPAALMEASPEEAVSATAQEHRC